MIYRLESVNRLTWITLIIWISQPLRLAKLDFTVRLLVLVAKLDSTVTLLLISDSTDNLRFHAHFNLGEVARYPYAGYCTYYYPTILYPGLFGPERGY